MNGIVEIAWTSVTIYHTPRMSKTVGHGWMRRAKPSRNCNKWSQTRSCLKTWKRLVPIFANNLLHGAQARRCCSEGRWRKVQFGGGKTLFLGGNPKFEKEILGEFPYQSKQFPLNSLLQTGLLCTFPPISASSLVPCVSCAVAALPLAKENPHWACTIFFWWFWSMWFNFVFYILFKHRPQSQSTLEGWSLFTHCTSNMLQSGGNMVGRQWRLDFKLLP